MMNIDNYFKFTKNDICNWNQDVLMTLSASIKNAIPIIDFDWEPGDEEWARFLLEKEVILIICARLPLAMGRLDYSERLSTFFEKNNMKFLVFKDFQEEVFSISKPLLEDVFSKKLSDNISYESISIGDLWWSTIT